MFSTRSIPILATSFLMIGLVGGVPAVACGFHSGTMDTFQSQSISSQETPPTSKADEKPRGSSPPIAQVQKVSTKLEIKNKVVPSKIVPLLEEKIKLLKLRADRFEKISQINNKTVSEAEAWNLRLMVYYAEVELLEEMGKDPIPMLEKILKIYQDLETKAKQKAVQNPGNFSPESFESESMARIQAEIALERAKVKQAKLKQDK